MPSRPRLSLSFTTLMGRRARTSTPAVVSAVLLERACRIQLLAMATGRDVRASDDAEALAKREHIYGDAPPPQAFDYLVRLLP